MRNAYAERYRNGGDGWTHQPEMRIFPALVHGRLKLSPETRALDVGCGVGHDGIYMARLYRHVTGIDIIPHESWSAASAEAPNFNLRRAGLLDPFAESDSFELITDNGCFHHQHPDDHQRYLARIAELLVPGGFAVFSTFKSDVSKSGEDAEGRIHLYFTDEELAQLFRTAKLQLLDQIEVYRAQTRDFYRLSFVTQ